MYLYTLCHLWLYATGEVSLSAFAFWKIFFGFRASSNNPTFLADRTYFVINFALILSPFFSPGILSLSEDSPLQSFGTSSYKEVDTTTMLYLFPQQNSGFFLSSVVYISVSRVRQNFFLIQQTLVSYYKYWNSFP